MSGGFRVDGVPSLWERRYNLSSADSFLSSLDFPAMKTPSSDVLLPCTASLYRYFHYRSLSLFLSSPTTISSLAFSSFLFSSSIAGFFFLFFGSATVPLAARESPLTRRMDDLRISSRSLSLVRSRYRSRSSVSSILSFSLAVFVFPFSSPAVSPPIPRSDALIRLLRLVYRKDSVVVFCIAMPRALTNESSAFGVAANK